jgi:hippurate hydrolase
MAKAIPERVFDVESLVALRRDLHAHPESAFNELRTSLRVASLLREWNIETTTGIGGTGVVGVIHGERGPGRTIALRADMDALPMEEGGSPEWRSTVAGVFHGCGHDGHTAMLLGAASWLSQHRQFFGKIVLLFQPAEENGGGALAMLADDAEARFGWDEIYGLHNAPHLPPGVFGVREGAMLASCDDVLFEIHGVGGHGSAPEKCKDPIMAAAQLICALQTVVSRTVDPAAMVVLSMGSLHAGTTPNVIPASASISGTLRTFDEQLRAQAKTRIEAICQGIAIASDCQISVRFANGSPATVNYPEQARAAARAAETVFGASAVKHDIEPLNGSEDFSEFLLRKPGAYALIGQGGVFCHHPDYDFNDDILPLGVKYLIALALDRLTTE